jgi:hypothetical protein
VNGNGIQVHLLRPRSVVKEHPTPVERAVLHIHPTDLPDSTRVGTGNPVVGTENGPDAR